MIIQRNVNILQPLKKQYSLSKQTVFLSGFYHQLSCTLKVLD